MLTNREVFRIVSEHLLKQMARSQSVDRGEECMYRGPGGLKCAVGVLIKDEYYSPSLEGKNVSDYGIQCALENSGVDPHTSEALLWKLQEIHDYCPVDSWRDQLNMLEKSYFQGPEVGS